MIQEYDFKILRLIQDHCRCELLDKIMPKLTLLGEMGIFWLCVAVIFMFRRGKKRCGITIAGGLFAGMVAGNLLLKNIVTRDRPCWIDKSVEMLIEVPKDYSFPSGHTLSSFIAATVIYKYDKLYGSVAYIIASLIGFSRLYLYVHFPTDVIAGAALGIMIGSLVTWFSKRLFKKFDPLVRLKRVFK